MSLVALLTKRGAVQAMIAFTGVSLSVSGCYLVLGAYFLAAMQMMVYIGGVLVLMAYALMIGGGEELCLRRWHPLAGGLSLAMMLLMAYAMLQEQIGLLLELPLPGIRAVGFLLVSRDSIVWEIVGLLLLIVALGVARILAVFGPSTSTSSDG